MLIKFILLLTLAVAGSSAEAPLTSGPYPAAGWRPQKPFTLPNRYLPPTAERQQQPYALEVEISKEPVAFAGQIQSNALLTNQPQNNYVAPNANYNSFNHDEDFLRVQALPHQKQPQFFHKQVLSRPAAPQFLNKQVLSRPATPQLLHKQVLSKPAASIPFGQRLPARAQQQPFQPEDQLKPAQQYGFPDKEDQWKIIYPDTPQESDNDDGTDNLTAIEALNAAIDEYNRREELKKSNDNNVNNVNTQAEDDGNGRFQQGQYYVLGPDNSIQRVTFTTTQDEEEAKTNGFTAQLKYTPVGELRDPVFKYNERGQLVRILK